MAVLKVLLFGYNGANNTGAEALLLSDIEDVRSVLGPEAHLTVPTLNEANLRRYLKEGPNLTIAPIPTLFFLKIRRLVKETDLLMLVEGSTYMDTWGSPLLWAFLWATHCAHSMGKPCLAYAVDAGKLSPFNEKLVHREASMTDLIITRSVAAAERLKAAGVTAPIEVTSDNALNFQPTPADERLVDKLWPGSSRGTGVVGLAVEDIYQWPVVMRPWGPREDCYKWPYYFSRSKDRRRQAQALATGYATLADRLIRENGKAVALFCMEELDEPIARQILSRITQPERVKIISAREYNASQITCLLRQLDLLVTSRYHAAILSLAAAIPQIALGHDQRLKNLYHELSLYDCYFIDPAIPNLWLLLKERADSLLADPEPVRHLLRREYQEHLGKARRNQDLLAAFAKGQGWEVALCPV